MKKLIYSILILSLLLSVIGFEVVAATEPITIQFWHNYDAGAGQIDVLNQLIAQFEETNPNITVNQVYLEWQALKNNVVAGATTGILPDVLRGDIGFVPNSKH